MSEKLITDSMPRRAFVRRVGTAGLGLAAASMLGTMKLQAKATTSSSTSLPVDEMEEILQTTGTVSNGVLSITQDRDDLGTLVGPRGIPFKPGFEIQNELTFQALDDGRAIFNGDFAALSGETQRVIDHILAARLTYQAFHMHYIDLEPQVWFMHARGVGDPLDLAKRVALVVSATHTPLPQDESDATTPLDVSRLEGILHGSAEVGQNGVVAVNVERREQIYLQGIPISPDLNVAHNIQFEPLNDDGSDCAVAPDFALVGHEVNPVFLFMRQHDFHIDCLYNQETDERPQLYFSHQIKRGNPYDLAEVIREALNRTNSE